MADPKRTSLNTATVRQQWTLAQAIEGCQRHNIGAITPWRNQVADYGLAQTAKHLTEAELTVTGLCAGGMFTTGESHQAMIDNNLRAIEQAATLQAACLILVVGGLPAQSRDLAGAHRQVEDAIAELLPHARAANVPLALEPLHPMYAADRACVNTMQHANNLCDTLGPGLGIALDVYHVWWDPELKAQIARAGSDRILAFHLCDWLLPTTDMALDRGMMGDGIIDLKTIRGWLEDEGFDGFYEVEIFSAQHWWQRDPDQVLKILLERVASAV